MKVLERKAIFVQSILNETNDEIFIQLENEYERLSKSETCMYSTMGEVRETVMQRKKDFDNGNMELISHEQIKLKPVL